MGNVSKMLWKNGVVRRIAGAGACLILVFTFQGCSWLPVTPDKTERYAPAPAQPVQVAQYVEEGRVVWRTCGTDCPQATLKTMGMTPPPVQTVLMEPVKQKEKTPDPDLYAVFFPFDQTTLGPKARAEITEIIPEAKKAEAIIITGRTDEVGSMAANNKVATLRAQSVAEAFTNAGIGAGKIEKRFDIKPQYELPKDLKTRDIPEKPAARARRADITIIKPLKMDTVLRTPQK